MGNVESELKDFRKEISTKLDAMTVGFATHKDLEGAKEQARREHKDLKKDIGVVDADVEDVKQRIDKVMKDTADLPIIRKLVYTLVSVVLLAVLAAVLLQIGLRGSLVI